MTITVTVDDIRRGKRCDPICCPIGRALTRAGVNHFGVVGPTVMIADGRNHATGMQLPDPIREWIVSFDGNEPVDPITFELPVPQRKPARGGRATRALVSAV